MRKAGTYITAFTVLATLLFLVLFGFEKQLQHKKRCCPSPYPPSVQVVVFTARWCGPCKLARPILAEIKAAGVEVLIIDVDERPDLAEKNCITSVPTYFVRTRSGVERTQDITVVLQLLGR